MTPIGPCAVVSIVLAAAMAVAEERTSAADPMPGRTAGPTVSRKTTAEPREHEMTGTVSRLDKSAGTVTIDVPGSSDIELRLPPEEIAGFREGDQVVVSMDIRDSRPTDSPGHTDDDRPRDTDSEGP